MKAKRDSIIDAYGYGHILYQSYKSDVFYKIQKAMVAEGEGCKELRTCIKKAKYSVIYTDKKQNRFIKMYFNSKDQLTAVITAYDYDSAVKSWQDD